MKSHWVRYFLVVVAFFAPTAPGCALGTDPRLVFELAGRPAADAGKLDLFIAPGPVLTKALRVYSEPSHTLLVVLIDDEFIRSDAGRAWLTNSGGGERARVVQQLRPRRPSSDVANHAGAIQSTVTHSRVTVNSRPAEDTKLVIFAYSDRWAAGETVADREVVEAHVRGDTFSFAYADNPRPAAARRNLIDEDAGTQAVIEPRKLVLSEDRCQQVTGVNEQGEPRSLIVRVGGNTRADGALELSVIPGPLATHAIRIYSEPSHTLLAVAMDATFAKTDAGKSWRARYAATTLAFVTTEKLGTASDLKNDLPAVLFTILGRPASDTQINAHVTSDRWPNVGTLSEYDAVTYNVGPSFSFSAFINHYTIQKEVCCSTSNCSVCSDCYLRPTKCCGTTTTSGSICCAVFCSQADCTTCI